MRLFKLKTSLLALILSVVGESVYFFSGHLLWLAFGDRTMLDVWQRSYSWTHWPAQALTQHICAAIVNVPSGWAFVMETVFALLEWWVVLFVSIWAFRHFHRKSA
jgi:hypothetical protein